VAAIGVLGIPLRNIKRGKFKIFKKTKNTPSPFSIQTLHIIE